MKIRHSDKEAERIELQMAPMIDVIFLLLIFFMLTLRIVEPEGDFSINMPIATPQKAQPDQPKLGDIKVRLIAATDGSLGQLMLGQRQLGSGSDAFERLNGMILRLIGRPGSPLAKDVEVEIDADYELDYEYFIKAVSACTGRLDESTSPPRIVRYVEKIKFAPPRRPAGAAE